MTALEHATAADWYACERLAHGIVHLHEHHIDPFYRCNIWFVAGRDGNLLVDSGLGAVSLVGQFPWLTERPLLAVASHAHFDHMGNIESFPNATFYIQERELTKWIWAMSLPDRLRYMMVATDPSDVLRAADLARQGRLRLVDGDKQNVLPGIDLHAAPDTHTYGCQWVHVRNDLQAQSNNSWVLAGDLIYVYENIEGMGPEKMYIPVGLALGSTTNLVLTTDEIM